MAKKIPVDEEVLAQGVDTAFAAYALAQLSFIALVQNGIITHETAADMLRKAIAINEEAGSFAAMASTRLKRVLELLEVDRKHRATLDATPQPRTRPS